MSLLVRVSDSLCLLQLSEFRDQELICKKIYQAIYMQNKHLFQLLVHAFFLEFQSSPVVASSKLPCPLQIQIRYSYAFSNEASSTTTWRLCSKRRTPYHSAQVAVWPNFHEEIEPLLEAEHICWKSIWRTKPLWMRLGC